MSTTSLAITIDVEADDEWAGGADRTYRNLHALPRLQDLCDEFGARPTYLVTYDVATGPDGSAIVRDLAETGRCEIASHLHAWTTPPALAELEADTGARPYLSEYPRDVQAEKLRYLTSAVGELTGRSPTSYRGGRWDIDLYLLDLLAERGYLVDTSVTPLISWRRAKGVSKGGPMHALAPQDAYHPAQDHLYRPGSHAVLEVPVTVAALGALPQRTYAHAVASCEHWRLVWAGLKRVMAASALSRRVSLDPVDSSSEWLVRLCDHMLREGACCLNMAFHSSELVAGCSPHVVTAEDEERVWGRIRHVLEFCSTRKLGHSTLSEYASRAGGDSTTDERTLRAACEAE